MAASHKVVSYALMNPVLWRRLPRELVVLVLARLPVPDITRLRCQLFKEWTINMEFNRACDEANPNMAALVSYAGQANEFLVRVFDFSKYVWLYEYRFRLTNRGHAPSWFNSIGNKRVWESMAGDGGLVCFVSIWKYTEANPLCIVVINPLTRVQHELPPLQYVYTVPPTLVHVKVDSGTKGYKVVVIAKKKGCHTVETYDSVSRQWSRAAPSGGRACEWQIRDRFYFCEESSKSCAYDLQEGQVELFPGRLLFQFEGSVLVKHLTLTGDRMFVLQKKFNPPHIPLGFYFITEFQFQNSAEVWVPVKTHGQCFDEAEDWPLDFHACEDLLLIRKRVYSTDQCWCFLNFSTSEWHKLRECSLDHQYASLICRAFWLVSP